MSHRECKKIIRHVMKLRFSQTTFLTWSMTYSSPQLKFIAELSKVFPLNSIKTSSLEICQVLPPVSAPRHTAQRLGY